MSCKTANSFFFEAFHQTSCRRGSSIMPSLCTDAGERDPGGIGFIDEIGGSVDGFVSCTESLGFESSDERSTDEGSSIDNFDRYYLNGRGAESAESTRKRDKERSDVKRREVKFPPPLSSLNRRGWPSCVLRSLRKDGRLELMEVKIRHREILCASRENGRLTLRFINVIDDEQDEEEDETEETRSEEMGENFDLKYGDELKEERREREGAVAEEKNGGHR